MKQLVILSGKGGAGKTSIAAAFSYLAHSGPRRVRAVTADADVNVLDGTPLLDIKPYVPEFDLRAATRIGWYATRSKLER